VPGSLSYWTGRAVSFRHAVSGGGTFFHLGEGHVLSLLLLPPPPPHGYETFSPRPGAFLNSLITGVPEICVSPRAAGGPFFFFRMFLFFFPKHAGDIPLFSSELTGPGFS